LTVAKTGDIVFVAAEVLLFCGSVQIRFLLLGLVEGTYLSLKEQNCWLMTCQTISSEDMADRFDSPIVDCAKSVIRDLDRSGRICCLYRT
jgi:hypothetical protein